MQQSEEYKACAQLMLEQIKATMAAAPAHEIYPLVELPALPVQERRICFKFAAVHSRSHKLAGFCETAKRELVSEYDERKQAMAPGLRQALQDACRVEHLTVEVCEPRLDCRRGCDNVITIRVMS